LIDIWEEDTLTSNDNLKNSLIDEIYHASSSSCQWQPVLSSIVEKAGFENSMIYLSDIKNDRVVPWEVTAYEMEMIPQFRDYYHKIDPWGAIWQEMETDRMYKNFDLVDINKFKESEYFTDFWNFQTFMHTCGGIYLKNDTYFGLITFVINKSSSKYPKGSVSLVESLMPHVRRAVQIQILTNSNAHYEKSIEHSLEILNYAVFLIKANKKIQYCNKNAERLLDNSNLIIKQNRLHIKDKKLDSALQNILQNYGSNTLTTNLLTIPNKHSGYLQLAILPFRRVYSIHQDGTSPVRSAIFILDTISITLPKVESLAKLLGLTKTEATLAINMLNGKNISEIAGERNVSDNTIRSQVKSVFKKTDAHSQAQLIRKIKNAHKVKLD
jgi:DNA-binding CsgD family transcriptional regulator